MRMFSATQPEVEGAVIDQLKGIQGVDLAKLSGASSFKEIGLDSLAQIEMYSALEEKFKITLSDEDTDGVKGVSDLVKIILSKLA